MKLRTTGGMLAACGLPAAVLTVRAQSYPAKGIGGAHAGSSLSAELGPCLENPRPCGEGSGENTCLTT